ncbi:MATN2 [Branchiostoma lanceolatum]|uniref:MATN2 protein n=1 Tax=Branchiostoma lanceolatum TaxID=7740 RepID=A0A8J9Z3Z8_BRALA|nr:MATN2 [Branchiostoma lanceolatum]
MLGKLLLTAAAVLAAIHGSSAQACVTFSTDPKYRYHWNLPELTGSSFTFEVKADNGAFVALSSQQGGMSAMYEILIGGWNNTQSVIRTCMGCRNRVEVSTIGILSPIEYRTFWITWSPDGAMAVGKGGETQAFMQWTDPFPLAIAYAGYTTGYESTGLWRFCGEACSADLVFVLDVSSSIPRDQFDLAKNFMLDFIACAAFQGHDIRVGVILYNCVPWTRLELRTRSLRRRAFNSPGIEKRIEIMRYEGGVTRTGVAIRYMKDTSDFRDGVPRAAVILTDGQTSDDSAYEAGVARAAGIDLYAVGVGIPGLVDQAALETITDYSDRVFDTTQACVAAQKIADDLCG